MIDSSIRFQIIPASQITTIIPLLKQLGSSDVSDAVLSERLQEMSIQNYECVGTFDGEKLMGACGMWFQTRHYAGKSCEVDHVIIHEDYRGKGIGNLLMEFVYDYVGKKGCQWVELNTFVENFPSHKFYYNQGFILKGYHFIKDINAGPKA